MIRYAELVGAGGGHRRIRFLGAGIIAQPAFSINER